MGGLPIGVATDIPGVELVGVVEALEVCSVLRVGLHPENAASNTAQNESAAKPPVSARRGLCTHDGMCDVARTNDGGSWVGESDEWGWIGEIGSIGCSSW